MNDSFKRRAAILEVVRCLLPDSTDVKFIQSQMPKELKPVGIDIIKQTINRLRREGHVK